MFLLNLQFFLWFIYMFHELVTKQLTNVRTWQVYIWNQLTSSYNCNAVPSQNVYQSTFVKKEAIYPLFLQQTTNANLKTRCAEDMMFFTILVFSFASVVERRWMHMYLSWLCFLWPDNALRLCFKLRSSHFLALKKSVLVTTPRDRVRITGVYYITEILMRKAL